MSAFTYQARDSKGSLVNGTIDAPNLAVVQEKLRTLGLFPTKVRIKPFQEFEDKFNKIFNPVRVSDKIAVTSQLFTLFKAGMNVDDIFGTLTRQSSHPILKDVLAGVQQEISSGSSLSSALAAYPKVFDRLYVNLVMSGEEGGILEEVLHNLTGLLESEAALKSRVKSALLYPKIVVGVLVMAMFTMLTWVVPKFSGFYGHFHAVLPLPTRILMSVGDFMNNYWYLVLTIMIAGVFAFKKYTSSKKGRLQWGKFLFQVPVFGPLNKKIANARFCHLIAALYSSGLPMTRCVELCAEVVDNGYFIREVKRIHSTIYRGKTLSEAMRACETFTPIIIDATEAGESSGSLDEILVTMGKHYDTEIDYTLKNLTTLLEPLLLFGIFGMVTLFALAIFLPMWNLSSVV
jgi:type II secretory pathway component PulF